MIFTILDNQSGFWLIHKISEFFYLWHGNALFQEYIGTIYAVNERFSGFWLGVWGEFV